MARSHQETQKNSFTVSYLDGLYNDDIFTIDYDIQDLRKYDSSPGYTTSYTEKFSSIQRTVMTSLYRAFGHFKKRPSDGKFYAPLPGDAEYLDPKKEALHNEFVYSHVQTEQAPQIFVIVFTNIKEGLETTLMMALEDLKRGSTDHNFIEEYQRRLVTGQPTGNPAAIGNQEGTHVLFHNVSWGEFLSKQMLYRIRYKFERSAFPPKGDPKEAIKTVAAATINAYNFNDFESLHLSNLNTNTLEIISKKTLQDIKSNPKTPPGKNPPR